MKDKKTREMMGELYRLVEKYEETPISKYTDDAEKWFEGALIDCVKFTGKYDGNEFGKQFAFGLFAALEERFKSVNKLPLIEREKEATQISLF